MPEQLFGASEKRRCACCGYQTISSEWDTCNVCFWEDNGYQREHELDAGGPNTVCLIEARTNFCDFGASERQFIDLVRAPLPTEKNT